MTTLVFDIETDGLLDDLTVVHCLVIRNRETGESLRFNNQPAPVKKAGSIERGLDMLQRATVIAGHNVHGFDIPALQKVYPKWKPRAYVLDTLVLSRCAYPDMLGADMRMERKRSGNWIPRNLYGRHSLEAWGMRLGYPKDDYAKRMKDQGLDPWAEWNPMMEDYCVQDTELNEVVLSRLEAKGLADEFVDLENSVAPILFRQMRRGWAFNTAEAVELYSELSEKRESVKEKLRGFFGEFYVRDGKTKTEKKSRRRFHPHPSGADKHKVQGEVTAGWWDHYSEGGDWCPVKLVEFNPASRHHIANRLQYVYGWKPKAFTDKGQPQVDESVIKALPYEPAPLLAEYLLLDKRIGQIAEGNEAWLKAEKDGVIYGRVDQFGAYTGRMTHSKPNLAQVPRNSSPYGDRCRALFGARRRFKLVGCDAEGLEQRGLAHYMYRWDGGEYAKAVVEGRKEEGTDAHTKTQRAVELNSRDSAKTWFYAFIYGASDWKLGEIIWADMTQEQKKGLRPSRRLFVKLGKRSRDRIAENFPALAKLTGAVQAKVRQTGTIRGLDGRVIKTRSVNAALNTLLQGAGAIVMKRALVILDTNLQDAGLVPGLDYEFVGNIHDEFQIEASSRTAEFVGKTAADSIRQAGEYYGMNCPLSGDYAIGETWAETH